MEYDERYQIRNEDIERILQNIGGKIGEAMPEGWGFGLFVFSYGENGSMFWLSSAQRKDIINSLKEFIEREEKKNGRTMETTTS